MAAAAVVATAVVTAVATGDVTILSGGRSERGALLLSPHPPPQCPCGTGVPHMAAE